jgi:hypothetical protein
MFGARTLPRPSAISDPRGSYSENPCHDRAAYIARSIDMLSMPDLNPPRGQHGITDNTLQVDDQIELDRLLDRNVTRSAMPASPGFHPRRSGSVQPFSCLVHSL